MLPEWLDVDLIRQGAVGLIVVLVVVSVLIARFVQKMVFRIIALLLVLGAAGGIYVYRDSLSECTATCSCRLMGQEIHVPSPSCDG